MFVRAKLCYKLLGYAFFPEKARNPVLSPGAPAAAGRHPYDSMAQRLGGNRSPTNIPRPTCVL